MERDNLPRIIRKIPELKGYPSTRKELFKGFMQQHLAEGVTPLGASPKYDEIVEKFEVEGVFRKWDKTYEEFPLDEAESAIRKREGLSEKPYIAFDNSGSYAILERVVDLLPLSPIYSEIVGIGHDFFGLEHFTDLEKSTDNQDTDTEQVLFRRPVHSMKGPRYISTIEEAREEMQHLIEYKTMDDWVMEEVEKERDEELVAYYLCDPATPTGDTVSEETRQVFLEYAARKKRLIIADQVFLTDRGRSWMKYTNDFDNLMVIDSLSKVSGLPGARLGYAVMSQGIGDEYKKLERYYHLTNTSRIKYNIALSEEVFDPWNDHVFKTTVKEKSALIESLEARGIKFLPTDVSTPIITIDGRNESFAYNFTRNFAVDVISGFGFRNLTGRFARAVVPIGREDRKLFVRRIKNAIDAGERPTRPLMPESTY